MQPKTTGAFWTDVLTSTLLVGTLDICSAFVYYYFKTGNNPLRILLYVASAAWGPDAYSTGNEMYLWGLMFHYFIAFAFTLLFYFLYPRLKLTKVNPLLCGIVYGLFIWFIMNRVVLGFTVLKPAPFNWTNALINMGILIAAIGIPLSYRIRTWCSRRPRLQALSV